MSEIEQSPAELLTI